MYMPGHFQRSSVPFNFVNPHERLLTRSSSKELLTRCAGAAERQCKRWRQIRRPCCMQLEATACRWPATGSSTEQGSTGPFILWSQPVSESRCWQGLPPAFAQRNLHEMRGPVSLLSIGRQGRRAWPLGSEGAAEPWHQGVYTTHAQPIHSSGAMACS